MENSEKNSIAICYICTGKYTVFWKDFFESFEEKFCILSQKHYYVFSDKKIIYKDRNNVHLIYQKTLGWPESTLCRFEMFSEISEELKKYKYVFFFNSNAYCKTFITEDEFLPQKEELLVVQHPYYYNKDCEHFSYERNSGSKAYIPFGQGDYYIAGGVNGGKSAAFLELVETLKKNIIQDNLNNVVALWHDESHLNKYIIGRADYKILSPAYCYPEMIENDFPFECKILIREKSKYFAVEAEKARGIYKALYKFKWYAKRWRNRLLKL